MMRCYTRRDLLRATYRNMYKKNAVRYNSIYYIRESKFIRPTLCSVIFFPCKSVDHFPNVNCVRLLISFIMFQCYTSVYPKVSGLAAWSENCKWYSCLPLGAELYRYFVSQSSEFCRHNPLCCFSTSVYYCKPIFFLSTQSGNFWIHLRKYIIQYPIHLTCQVSHLDGNIDLYLQYANFKVSEMCKMAKNALRMYVYSI
jgi:hypothetical protein